MSELAIVFGDLHVHNYRAFNENNRRLNNCIAVLNYVFNLARKNKIKYLLMTGDLHNLMEIISTKAINAVIRCLKNNFEQYPEIQMVAISGNHDYADKHLWGQHAESALDHLSEVFPNNFELLDLRESETNRFRLTKNGNMLEGIPYYEYPEHFITALKERTTYKPGTGKKILLMHQVVASGLPIEDHIQHNDPLFDNYDFIFNGHIHKPQEVSYKFINVGSPLHRDAGDIGQDKGIWIVDLDDPVNTVSFHDMTSKFPVYIQRDEDKELDEWESKQYVIRIPKLMEETPEDKSVVENFTTNLQPAEIMKNYCSSMQVDEETLNYGLKLL